MSEQMDELVEEMAALFCPVCDAYDVYGARCKIYLKPSECDEASLGAELALASTLKAVVDGELDEELGVVGRQFWPGGKRPTPEFQTTEEAERFWAYWFSLMAGGGADTFIALSPIVHEEEKK